MSPKNFTFVVMSINKNLDPASENLSTAEKEIERALRPLSFDDFA